MLRYRRRYKRCRSLRGRASWRATSNEHARHAIAINAHAKDGRRQRRASGRYRQHRRSEARANYNPRCNYPNSARARSTTFRNGLCGRSNVLNRRARRRSRNGLRVSIVKRHARGRFRYQSTTRYTCATCGRRTARRARQRKRRCKWERSMTFMLNARRRVGRCRTRCRSRSHDTTAHFNLFAHRASRLVARANERIFLHRFNGNLRDLAKDMT